MTVLFVCTHNAGRSQMAAALFARAAKGKARVLSAGTNPASAVHPVVREALAEIGISLTTQPRLLTLALAQEADVLVTTGCGESCPSLPGVRREDWAIDDPKDQPLERVRAIRDEIADHVAALISSLGL
jgi:arsenate reductase (thioredoxin)